MEEQLPSIQMVFNKRAGTFETHKEPSYIRGPIPWDWMCQASLLSGKTVQVGLALWHLRALRKASTVALSSWALESLGVSTKRATEALLRLEGAGLVRVTRKRGRVPRVELLEAPLTPASSDEPDKLQDD